MISSLLAGLDDLLQQGQDLLNVGDLLIGDQDVGVVQNGFHLVGVGDHVGGDVAPVELHALDHVADRSRRSWTLLDGDDAVGLPTFSMASAISLPMVSSPEETVADTGDVGGAGDRLGVSILMASTAASTALSMPLLHDHGVGAGGHDSSGPHG